MLQDFRFALRSLGHAKALTAAAVLTLAVGLGASTGVYSVVDALLLRPLPFGGRAGRLVTLHSTHPTRAQDWDNSGLSYPDLVDIREQSRSLEDLQGVLPRNFSMSSTGDTERVTGASITPGLFSMLGVTPARGRLFTESEGASPGLEQVAIISDTLWQRLYGGDPGIVGRSVMMNGRQVMVVGVMPPRFGFPENHDVWLPLRLPADADRSARAIIAVGLLREGVSVEDARAEIGSIGSRLAQRFPVTNRQWDVFTMPMRNLFVSPIVRRALTTMLAAVALVLLVGCANVASLLVARGVGRQREMAVRTALGAPRWQLVRLLLLESFVLALVGGALGVLLASWGLDAFVASNPEPPPYWASLQIDGRVLGFAFGLAVLTAVACGLVPAVRATSPGAVGGPLQGSRTAGATPDQRRFQSALVVSQVAVSLALLVGAMLLAGSARALQHADAGFNPDKILSLRLYLPGDRYDVPAARARALGRAIAESSRVPGVIASAATGAIPADDGGDGIDVLPEGATLSEGAIGAQVVPAMGRLFQTLGLRVTSGREFTAAESESDSSDVAIVNERLARKLWPAQAALGRTLRIASGSDAIRLRIVGVVPDLVYEELGEETAPSQLTVYVPYARLGWRTMALLVRTAGDPAAAASAVRPALRRVDASFAVYDVMTMADRRSFTQWGERFLARTFGAFSLAALLLAAVGAYGLTAYSAAQRTREIGLRMAIGSTPGEIMRLLVGRGVQLALIGLGLGLPIAVAASRALQGLLFRVSPSDARLWVFAPVVLSIPVLIANLIPAYRASRRDPAEALRQD